MSEPFHIPAGTRFQFGVPARSLPDDIRQAITRHLTALPEIIEAHLPMCHVHGAMPEPALVLIIVFVPGTSLESTMPKVMELINSTLPENSDLQVWPFNRKDYLLGIIRKVNYCLFSKARPRPWWKLW